MGCLAVISVSLIYVLSYVVNKAHGFRHSTSIWGVRGVARVTRIFSKISAPHSFEVLDRALDSISVSERNRCEIIQRLVAIGISKEDELLGFLNFEEERLVEVLVNDFEISKLHAHQIRAAISTLERLPVASSTNSEGVHHPLHSTVDLPRIEKSASLAFKEYRVKSQKHSSSSMSGTGMKKGNYGLKDDDISPVLREQLEEFLLHMTEQNALSQEPPIRMSTAEVYLRHAKLFCGWWISVNTDSEDPETGQVSLEQIFPTKEKTGATALYEFIRWLKHERDISDSYEANFLRGISKLLKFRFATESQSDPSYGDKSYEDVPMIREVRKLHRDANRRQKIAPRVSDEDKKWLSWPEYLAVVQRCKVEIDEELRVYQDALKDREEKGLRMDTLPASLLAKKRKIAQQYQRYIVLALLATVPDRQRTFRELEIGKTFFREERGWLIKHGPDDYKTGNSYGDRPPLRVAASLTKHIDGFVEDWRPVLQPSGSHLFAQARTGKPFTSDTMYSIVARACYACTGKKTNPHLLRDMIVTHARGTDASEKELEALALFMGHSISMQRSSYDRRSLSQKVEPAQELLQSISQF